MRCCYTLAFVCCCHALCTATQTNQSSMTWLQDLFSFCALALVLHIGIFILYITRARTYYHGPSDVVKRVVNIFLGAFPTGLATVLIFSLVDCSSPAHTHTHTHTHTHARTHAVRVQDRLWNRLAAAACAACMAKARQCCACGDCQHRDCTY